MAVFFPLSRTYTVRGLSRVARRRVGFFEVEALISVQRFDDAVER